MATLLEMRNELFETSDYDEETVVVPGYGTMRFSQVRKLAIEQLELALGAAKQDRWGAAAKQLDLYSLFAKTAQAAQERFDAVEAKKGRKR